VSRVSSGDHPKPVRWVGSSKADLSDFSEEVRRRVGGALWEAQIGRKAPYAKPLKGFGDAGVLEIVEDFDGDTFNIIPKDSHAKQTAPLPPRSKPITRNYGYFRVLCPPPAMSRLSLSRLGRAHVLKIPRILVEYQIGKEPL
jgi:hypothetical protein